MGSSGAVLLPSSKRRLCLSSSGRDTGGDKLSDVSAYKGINAIMGTPASWPHLSLLSPKGSISKYRHSGVRAPTSEFGGTNSVPSNLSQEPDSDSVFRIPPKSPGDENRCLWLHGKGGFTQHKLFSIYEFTFCNPGVSIDLLEAMLIIKTHYRNHSLSVNVPHRSGQVWNAQSGAPRGCTDSLVRHMGFWTLIWRKCGPPYDAEIAVGLFNLYFLSKVWPLNRALGSISSICLNMMAWCRTHLSALTSVCLADTPPPFSFLFFF